MLVLSSNTLVHNDNEVHAPLQRLQEKISGSSIQRLQEKIYHTNKMVTEQGWKGDLDGQ